MLRYVTYFKSSHFFGSYWYELKFIIDLLQAKQAWQFWKSNIQFSNLYYLSSRGGLEVEQWTDNSTLSILVVSNPARHQKDFRSNSNTKGGALIIIIVLLGD